MIYFIPFVTFIIFKSPSLMDQLLNFEFGSDVCGKYPKTQLHDIRQSLLVDRCYIVITKLESEPLDKLMNHLAKKHFIYINQIRKKMDAGYVRSISFFPSKSL